MVGNLINSKFNYIGTPTGYPHIRQTSVNGKRAYQTADGTYPSITQVLSSVVPPGILEWRKSVGDDVANYVMRVAAKRGRGVHSMLRQQLTGSPIHGMVAEYGLLESALYRLMQPAVQRIDDIRGIEIPVYSSKLCVAGMADVIADFDGIPSVVDWKTATRLYDEINKSYILQATFYAVAWEELTGEKLDQIVIVVASEQGLVQVFKDKPSDHVRELRKVIREYRKSHG